MKARGVFAWLMCVALALVIGCDRKSKEPVTPAPPGHSDLKETVVRGRLIMLGFDGVDPRWLERWMGEGKLPTLKKLTEAHDGAAYRHLRSTNPPQSPVAWTSFATGTRPGDHGIFDFIGRTLPTSGPLAVLPRVATTSFEPQAAGPPVAKNLRSGEPFWQTLGNDGVRVVALNVPYSFPPDPMRSGRILSGLGVPDLRETNSTFTYAGAEVTAEQVEHPPGGGVMAKLIVVDGVGRFELEGPSIVGDGGGRMKVPVEVRSAEGKLHVTLGRAAPVALVPGAFSDWVEVTFSHGGREVRGILRLLALEAAPRMRLFVTPISFHPRAPYSPVSYPRKFSATIADELASLYKTVGWDHDTSALNAEVIDEAAFLADMESIEADRRKMLMKRLDDTDWDLLVWVSTATDRVAHMFYRLIDPEHPRYDAALAEKYGGAIENEYRRMDATVAEVLAKLRPEDTLLILSDHGFHGYRRGLHVNQWLRREGLLALKGDVEASEREFFMDVDWSRTRAYAMGTGQIYLNKRGREREGTVDEGAAAGVLAQIRDGLVALRDKERGEAQVVSHVYAAADVFEGKRRADAPDLQIAFAENYRTSWETILGGVPAGLFADNPRKWSGDHAASDVEDTPGILISTRPLAVNAAEIVDLAPTALRWFGRPTPTGYAGKPLLEAP